MAVLKAVRNVISSVRSEGSFASNIKYYTLYFAVTFIAQLFFTPIIARVFTAESYGVFSIVSSLAAYVSLFFTLQLEPAIVVQQSNQDSQLVSRSIFTISSLAFVVAYLLIGIIAAWGHLLHSWTLNDIAFLFWVPLLALLIAAHSVYGNIANRSKQYKKIFHYMSPTFLGAKVVTIGWGKFISNNFFGLFLGELLYRLAAVIIGFKFIIGDKIRAYLQPIGINKAVQTAKKHSSYILFELPLRVISLLSSQMPVYLLAIYYNVNVVGQFAFANALLEIPVRLISYSFSTVFFQKSSEVINSGGEMLRKSLKMLGGLFLLGIPPFLLLYFFSGWIFSILFGPQWSYAADLAVSLVVFYFSRFVFEPFQVLFRVLGKLRLQFYISAIYFVTFGVYLLVAMSNKGDLIHIFQVMSVMSLVYMLIQTLIIFRLLKFKNR